MTKTVLLAALFASFSSLSRCVSAAAGVVGVGSGDGGEQRVYENVTRTRRTKIPFASRYLDKVMRRFFL